MPDSPNVTENQVAFVALQIAAKQSNGIATFKRIKKDLPNYIDLSPEDRRMSKTRPNEEVWEQRIRNIKSHDSYAGNYIFEGYLEHVPRSGYRITDRGRRYLKKGY
jgi:hypothetical protein